MEKDIPRFSLAELSEHFELELHGDGNHEISGVGTLKNAGPGEISFLSNRVYREQLESTNAGAVILQADDAAACPVNCLLTDDPYAAFARIAARFEQVSSPEPGIHPSAIVHETAEVAGSAHVGPNAVIEAGARVGSGCSIGPGSVVGPSCEIGAGSILKANVTLVRDVRLGKRVTIHPGAVIGARGFGLAFTDGGWQKVPQLGGVRIGDDCEIGANTTIDRGAIEDTVLEQDVRIDNLVQVGHNVIIGAHTAIAGCAGVAGSARIGRNCLLGGRVGIQGHISIADGVTIGINSMVTRDITDEGTVWSGTVPSLQKVQWQRNLVHMLQLDKIVKRLRKLEGKYGKSQADE